MKYNLTEITNAEHDGVIVYICDIRHNDSPFSKLIRNVPPIKVIIQSNDELPSNKRVNYSLSHFKKLNKYDEPLKSSIIKPFDNTGYRSFTGIGLNVFDNMDECIEFYKAQRLVISTDMKKEISSFEDKYIQFLDEF